jgi:hypothetical protein
LPLSAWARCTGARDDARALEWEKSSGKALGDRLLHELRRYGKLACQMSAFSWRRSR